MLATVQHEISTVMTHFATPKDERSSLLARFMKTCGVVKRKCESIPSVVTNKVVKDVWKGAQINLNGVYPLKQICITVDFSYGSA